MSNNENNTASIYDYARAFNISPGKVQAAMYQADGDGDRAIAILKENLRSKGDPAFTKRVPKGGPKLEEKPMLAAVGRLVEPVNPPVQAPRTMGASPKDDQDAMLRIAGLKTLKQQALGNLYYDQDLIQTRIDELESEKKNDERTRGQWWRNRPKEADF